MMLGVMKRSRLRMATVYVKTFGIFLLVNMSILAEANNETSNCNSSQSSVPVPMVEYMLNGELHVSWELAREETKTYTANYCCYKPDDSILGKCLYVCPQYQPVHDCSYEINNVSHQVEYKCRFMSSLYIPYKILLADTACNQTVKGNFVEIVPDLTVAHTPEVKRLNVTTKKSGAVLKWAKPQSYFHQLCYFVSCVYIDVRNKRKISEMDQAIANNSIFLPFPNASPGTNYSCCVKVQGCIISFAVSKKTCNNGQTFMQAFMQTTSGIIRGTVTRNDAFRQCRLDIIVLFSLLVFAIKNGV